MNTDELSDNTCEEPRSKKSAAWFIFHAAWITIIADKWCVAWYRLDVFSMSAFENKKMKNFKKILELLKF